MITPGREKVYSCNSHEWSRQSFSLQYQNNTQQTSDENKEKYQQDGF